jgi:hypothetical protein
MNVPGRFPQDRDPTFREFLDVHTLWSSTLFNLPSYRLRPGRIKYMQGAKGG